MTTPILQTNQQLSSGTVSAAQYNEQLFKMGSALRGLNIPLLTVGAGLGFLAGQAGGAGGALEGITAAEAQLADTTFQVGTAFKEVYAKILSEMNPYIEQATDLFLQLDDATGGVSTAITGAGVAALALVAALRALGLGGVMGGAIGGLSRLIAVMGSATLVAGTLTNTLLAAGAAAGVFSYVHEKVDDWLKDQGLSGGIPGSNPTIIPNLPPFVTDYIEEQIAKRFGPSPNDPGQGPTAVPQLVPFPGQATPAYMQQPATVVNDNRQFNIYTLDDPEMVAQKIRDVEQQDVLRGPGRVN